jgi:ATP-dependent DNA helicase PIF1
MTAIVHAESNSSIILDPEQENAIRLMNSGNINVFLTGGGGTGKSKVLETFISNYKKRFPTTWRQLLGITSTTGSSALLIGGTTIHSFSGIGVSRTDDDVLIERLAKRRYLSKRWRELKTLIIDEVSMLTPRSFQLIYKLAQTIRKNTRPFGGVQIILSGDFCQLAPILEQHISNHTMEYCFEAPEWSASEIHTVYFKKIHRQTDMEFISALQKIRMGISDQDTTSLLMQQFRKNIENPYGIMPVQLFPTRDSANEVNQKHFMDLSKTNEINTFSMKIDISMRTDMTDDDKSSTTAASSESNDIKIHRAKSQLPIDDSIYLCIGCQVILVINLSIEDGLINGSKGKIEHFNENGEPVIMFSNGVRRAITLHEWEIEDGPHIIKAYGLPVILGYGCTIHRSQGMSIDLAIIDIGRSIFKGAGGYGQIYVALSRVRTLHGLSILNFDPSRIKCHPKVIEFYRRIDELSVKLSPELPGSKSHTTSTLTPRPTLVSSSSSKSSKSTILNYFTTLTA